MIERSPVNIDKLFEDGTIIDEAIAEAGRDARLRHKQLGVPLVVWRDGKVVEIPPEETVVDPQGEKCQQLPPES